MKVYAPDTDSGFTYLLNGRKVRKDDTVVEICGSIDELVSVLGFANNFVKSSEIKEELKKVQLDLFRMTTKVVRDDINTSADITMRVKKIEDLISSTETRLDPLNKFILSYGSSGASALHFARTVCRRAERNLSRLKHEGRMDPEVLKYFNRLSDLLFNLSRLENKSSGGIEEVLE